MDNAVVQNPTENISKDENEITERFEDISDSSFLKSLTEFDEAEEAKNIASNMQTSGNGEFQIRDRGQANYFVKKLKEAYAKKKDIEEFASSEIAQYTDRVNAWREKEERQMDNDASRLEGFLQEYLQNELKTHPQKKKSISLPYGSIGFRKQPTEYQYDNEDATIDFLKKDPVLKDCIRIKESIDKKDLKKKCKVVGDSLFVNGQKVPNVTVIEKEDKFECK